MLDGLPGITHISLHYGFPGDTGANEVTGGSYARAAVVFGAATNGVKTSISNPTFFISAGAVITHIGIWSSSTFIASTPVSPSSYGGDGTYTVIGANISLD